jgi:hypothetical protein
MRDDDIRLVPDGAVGKLVNGEREITGRDGEAKADMLAWFRQRRFWCLPSDNLFLVLNQLKAYQLDLLAGAVTAYGLNKYREGHMRGKAGVA